MLTLPYFHFSSNLNIWSGFISLSHLSAKLPLLNSLLATYVFRSLLPPLELLHCSIGRLELTIPWSSLGTKPVVIVVDRINVLAANPSPFVTPEQYATLTATYRKNILTALEKPPAPAAPDSGGFKKWLVSGLLSKLTSSLEIHVRDVHLRLELTTPTHTFATGITLETFHVHDEGSDADVTKDVITKLSQLNFLAIYFNDTTPCCPNPASSTLKTPTRPASHSSAQPHTLDFLASLTPSSISTTMTDLIPRRSHTDSPLPHTYLLRPFNCRSSLLLTLLPTPTLTLSLSLTSLYIALTATQCVATMSALQTLKSQARNSHNSPHRPSKFTPRGYWKYAIASVLSLLRRRSVNRGRGAMGVRRLMRVAYMELYGRKCEGVISKEEGKAMRGMEMQTNVTIDDVIVWRAMVHKKLNVEPAKPVASKDDDNE